MNANEEDMIDNSLYGYKYGFNNLKILTQHSDIVNTLIVLKDGRLASCSNDKTIKVYNQITYHCDITIKGHKYAIYYITQLFNTKLVSCSADKSIKIWVIFEFSYQCEYTIDNAHDNVIMKVIQLSNNKIASCSYDGTIKAWNSNSPYNHIITLTEKKNSLISSIIQLNGKEILISGSNEIRIWNLLIYQCETKIKNVSCTSPNSLIEVKNKNIIVGGKGLFVILNMKYEIVKMIENYGIGEINSIVKLKDGDFLLGNEYGRLCLCNETFDKIVVKNKAHYGIISCLININNNKIYSCSHDGNIKIWEY